MNDAFLRGFQDELEKRGIIGELALGGLVSHVGTNIALGRAMKGKRFMPDILRAGYKHGLARRRLSPFREAAVRQALGPEIPHTYHQARELGRIARVAKKAKTPESKGRMVRYLKERAGKQSMPEIQKHLIGKTPEDIAKGLRGVRVELAKLKRKPPDLVKHTLRAALRERMDRPLALGGRFMHGETGKTLLKGKKQVPVPARFRGKPKGPVITAKEAPPESPPKATVHEKYRPSKAKKAIYTAAPAAATVAGTFAGVPHAPATIGHFGINLFRDVASRSKRGQGWVKRMVARARAGRTLPGEAAATHGLVSPGVAQLQEAGRAFGKLERAATSRQLSPKPLAPAVAKPLRRVQPARVGTTVPTP